ncbi:hypothetical protein BDQ12DRAFT_730919 [Crucibulum laeve]|uniref:Uncharacterized protein n=1 Tax=Crucibulum laeve TaxID=68775 RepID=A0A5C3MKL1_9AGAR|nr:hypothetical protein BDQ12DRAFT_730919 [Crucibulum laeve]
MANNADISQPRITSSGTYNASQKQSVPQELARVLSSSQPLQPNTPAGYSQQPSTGTSHRREQGGTNAQPTGNFGAPRITHATHPHHTSTQQQAMRQAPRHVNDHSSRSRSPAHVPASEAREPSTSLAVPDVPLQTPHVAAERLSPMHTTQSPFERPSSNADQPYTPSAAQNGVLHPQSLSHGMSSTSPMRQQADCLAFQPTDPVFSPIPSLTQPEMREISPMNLLSQILATSRHSPFHFHDPVASSGDDEMEWPLLIDESHDEQQTGQPVGTSAGQINSRQHNMGTNNCTPIQHSCPTVLPQSSSLPSAETGDEHHSASAISHDTATPPTVSAAVETPRPRRPAREPLDILDKSEDNMIKCAIDGIAIAKADNIPLCQLFSSLNHFSTEVRYDDQIFVCNNIQEVLERAERVIRSKMHSLHWSHRRIAGNKQSPWYINFAGRVQEFIIILQKPQEIGRRPYNLKDLNVSTTALVDLYDLLADMELIVGNISALHFIGSSQNPNHLYSTT